MFAREKLRTKRWTVQYLVPKYATRGSGSRRESTVCNEQMRQTIKLENQCIKMMQNLR